MEKVAGFVKAKGRKIINGKGEEILLRGVGLGGWLLPEGYMWQFPEQGDRPWKIESYIEKCIGKTAANHFWSTYRNNFITESDIIRIKEEGFNSIRLPFNSRLLMDKGTYNESELYFIDRVINWCEDHRLYVILDMHGAPGGQTGSNIDDSVDDQPSLFMNREHQVEMVDLWRFLAERYKDRWIIAGYDLMNEPLPEWFSEYNHMVMPLYEEIIEAIRQVDKDHMIVLEGVHWSTDWSIFDKILDDNILYQFHKYWNNPDQESIRKYIEFREKYNVPIFMGEGGENNKEWYIGAFSMFEDLDISWNFWTYKKMEKDNSLCSIKKPENWENLARGMEKNEGLDSEEVVKILNEFLKNILFEQCVYYKDVGDALLCRAPIRIPAIFYAHKGQNESYYMAKNYEKEVDFRIGDHSYIKNLNKPDRTINFANGAGQKWQYGDRTAVRLKHGEWLNYRFYVPSTDLFTLSIMLHDLADKSSIELLVDHNDKFVTETIGKDMDESLLKKKFALNEGSHTIRIKCLEGKILLEWFEIDS